MAICHKEREILNMEYSRKLLRIDCRRWIWRTASFFATVAIVCVSLAGCGTDYSPKTSSTSETSKTYLAPWVAGSNNNGTPLYELQRYVIDSSAATVTQIDGAGVGHILNYGTFSTTSRGLMNIEITTNYSYNSTTGLYDAQTYNPAQTGNWAIELADASGGLVQLKGQPASPLVNATNCPSYTSAQTFQFVTIPAPLGLSTVLYNWGKQDIAYGSVDIGTSGNTVNFANIKQYTLPSVGGTPTYTASSSETGDCSTSSYGYVTSVPGSATVTDPGTTSQTEDHVALVGIGASGLLVENNDNAAGESASAPYYNPVLGAGTGAVGLPKPSSTLDTSSLAGAQYLGFMYGAGYGGTVSSSGWTSTATSFGFSSAPSSCSSLVTKTSTMIYGGDFPNNDPSTSTDGYGNCNLAIDLGTQDASNNGLYPNATVWVGGGFTANSSKTTYSFPAVAIAGKLGTKYAIFLIGLDSTQPWGIYLLQSN